MDILSVEKLCKSYDEFRLDNVSFSLQEGYIMGFIGSNGAGKTTTLKGILNLIDVDSGSVSVLGREFKSNELALKQDIAFMIGDSGFYQKKKVGCIADVVRRFYTNWDDDVFEKHLKRFNISKNKTIKELSKGMRVKFSLAMALSHNANLIILDEPTSGLDPVARDELLEVFQELIEDGKKSVLFSTHITSDLEKCADFITFIQNGRLIASAEKYSILSAYSLVSGSTADLTAVKDRLISYKKNSLGFTGLIENTKFLQEDRLNREKPKIEDIMIYFAKAEKVRAGGNND